MTNTNKLKEVIKLSGYKLEFIADYIGISRHALYKKINNLSYFNQFEIERLCELLNIRSLKVKEEIFFAD